MLSDIGSWASIIGFIFSFIVGVGLCKVIRNNKQVNKIFSFFSSGDINQSNNSKE